MYKSNMFSSHYRAQLCNLNLFHKHKPMKVIYNLTFNSITLRKRMIFYCITNTFKMPNVETLIIFKICFTFQLMHEMTKAVASGSNIDGVNPALILADLTNQRYVFL